MVAERMEGGWFTLEPVTGMLLELCWESGEQPTGKDTTSNALSRRDQQHGTETKRLPAPCCFLQKPGFTCSSMRSIGYGGRLLHLRPIHLHKLNNWRNYLGSC